MARHIFMRKAALVCLLIFGSNSVHAQLPAQQKVAVELQRMYKGQNSLLQSWKGPLARNLGSLEYESMYTFPGTSEPRIKQRSSDKKVPVYYYEALIGEGKTGPEVRRLLKDWEALLAGCSAEDISLQVYDRSSPDDQDIPTVTYTVTSPSAVSDKGSGSHTDLFQVHLNYEQGDDSLYSAYIQIGRP